MLFRRLLAITLIAFSVWACGSSSEAATKAQSVQFLLSQVRASGVALSGGKVYFYAAGTTTLKTVWLDRNKATVAANPYTLDANGTAQLYGDGLYRVVIKDSAGITKYDRDNLAFRDITNLAYSVADYSSLAAAVASIGSTSATLEYSTDQTLSANLAIPTNIQLAPINGAKIIHGSYTITFTTPDTSMWPDAQMFSGTGAITGLTGKTVYPVWFGAASGSDSKAAVQTALNSGGRVLIPHGVSYTAKNLAITTTGQDIVVDGEVKLPASCADEDAIFYASNVGGIRITGKGELDGNKAAQSGSVSQQLIRLVDCDNVFIGGGLTLRGNYSGATSSYAAVYVSGNYNKIDNVYLYDWGKEGVYLNDSSYSSVSNVVAIDDDEDSWSAVQVGGEFSVHNRISNITTKNTGASAVGLDSQYSTVENITVDTVRFQNGVNLGHQIVGSSPVRYKSASHSTVSNVVVKDVRDSVNANSAGLNIGGASENVSVNNITVNGSSKRGMNISDGARNVKASNLVFSNCSTAFAVYSSGRVGVVNMKVEGATTTGIRKDYGGSGHTFLSLMLVDVTAAINRIIGAAAGLTTPYIQYVSTIFESNDPMEGATDIAGLGVGGTTTVTNVNARAIGRIILEPSNEAGASAMPFISTQNDGSFVITTVNNGSAGAFVRWKII